MEVSVEFPRVKVGQEVINLSINPIRRREWNSHHFGGGTLKDLAIPYIFKVGEEVHVSETIDSQDRKILD